MARPWSLPTSCHVALAVAVGVATGWLLAVSWITPAAYPATWAGYAVFFLFALGHRPLPAFFVGSLIGAVALAMAFLWAPATLALQFDLSPLWTWSLFVCLITWESVPFGLLGCLASRTLRAHPARLWMVPVTWVAIEYYWPKVFPWAIAHSQTSFVGILQIAEVTGAGGIGLVLLAVTLIPAALLSLSATSSTQTQFERRSVVGYSLLSLALLLGVLAFGYQRQAYWERRTADAPSIHVAIVQVDPSYTDSIAKMRQHSQQSRDEHLDLICWPESTLGNYRADLNDFRDEQRTLQSSMRPYVDSHPAADLSCELLAGGKTFHEGAADEGPFFQTAFLIRPHDETIVGRYQKRSLLPIGEYIPGQEYLPKLREWANLEDTIIRGRGAAPLVLREGARLGVLMCYEDMVPTNARQSVEEGAQALLCLMNGSAFPHVRTLEQHMRLALLRAVENRRYFARCAATGVSCVISATGAMAARVDTNVETTLVADIPLLDDVTIFTRFGYLFPAFCLLPALAFAAWDLRKRNRVS
ncbi:MAG: apolipoprotein N-acyltransferase [Pirellulaceae bacterium]